MDNTASNVETVTTSVDKVPEYLVLDGLGGAWATYTRSADGASIHRVKSPKLPVRQTKREAQEDLYHWLLDKMASHCPASDTRERSRDYVRYGEQLKRVKAEIAEADGGG